MSLIKSKIALGGLLVLAGTAFLFHGPSAAKVAPSSAKPALTVTATVLKPVQWKQSLSANGSIVPWQEAIIGSEIAGVRIADVRASVGDRVVKGQILATLASETLAANEAESQAALREGEAVLNDASANAARMKKLADSGFVSAQQAAQAAMLESTARAKLDAQRARLKASAQRLSQQYITAPDAGVISARSATVGALTGGELFRLIRQGRLEWHADVMADELPAIKKGMKVALFEGRIQGVVRAISPVINPQTRYGQVLVDLPYHSDLVSGMFAKGVFVTGEKTVSVLPQSAVMLRDNSAYVLVVGADSRVSVQKVTTGQRQDKLIEITGGLEPEVPVVEAGGAFLVAGDQVRVIGLAK